MKKTILLFILILLILAFNPQIALNGALGGLNLWFEVIVPTLLPYMIISQLINNVYGNTITRPIAFIILTGILCGFPMGAHTCVNAYNNRKISEKSAYILLVCCNISSPAFLYSYIACKSLKITGFPLLLTIIIYLPVLAGIIYAVIINSNKSKDILSGKDTVRLTYEKLDASVTDSVMIILKLGAYIIIFSVIAEFVYMLPIHNEAIKCLLTGAMEITTGISYVSKSGLDNNLKMLLIIAINCFGGVSCIMQSDTFIKQTGLDIKKYIYGKFLLACITTFLGYLSVYVLKLSFMQITR